MRQGYSQLQQEDPSSPTTTTTTQPSKLGSDKAEASNKGGPELEPELEFDFTKGEETVYSAGESSDGEGGAARKVPSWEVVPVGTLNDGLKKPNWHMFKRLRKLIFKPFKRTLEEEAEEKERERQELEEYRKEKKEQWF